MGYGQGYKYAHDYPGGFVQQQNLPESLQGKRYYSPGNQGYEKQINTRLRNWWKEQGSTDDIEKDRED